MFLKTSLPVAALLLYAQSSVRAATFEATVQPVLGTTCKMCHNDKTVSGGLNINLFLKPASLTEQRAGWETIIQKIQSGEMPPKGIPRPPADQLQALIKYVESEFGKPDHGTLPDPGRVVAHRLNRREYSHTISDLLDVEFHAERAFPTH